MPNQINDSQPESSKQAPNHQQELSPQHIALLDRITQVFGISAALRMKELFIDLPDYIDRIESDPQAQQQMTEIINQDLPAGKAISLSEFPSFFDDEPNKHKLDSKVSSDLNTILTDVGNSLGVTVRTTSGYRQPKKGDSGRHHGDASDVALSVDGRELSLLNSKDRPIVQEFTRRFLLFSRQRGFTPSVGCANHNHPHPQTGVYYMKGNHYHYDIAVGRSIDSNRDTSWGGSNDTKGTPAPDWLKSVMKNPSVPFLR